MAKLPRRIWNTLHEPRVASAIMVVIYLLLAAVGAVVLKWWEPTPNLVLGSWFLIIGGVVGAFAAWPGFYALEAPIGLVLVYGLILILGVRVDISLTDGRPFVSALLCAVIALFFCTRITRIWPYLRRGQRDPKYEAKVKATLAKEEYERVRDER